MVVNDISPFMDDLTELPRPFHRMRTQPRGAVGSPPQSLSMLAAGAMTRSLQNSMKPAFAPAAAQTDEDVEF